MQYYDNSLYLFTGLYIYRYDLHTGNWFQHTLSGISINEISNNAICIYEDNLYSILGWDNTQQTSINFIYKISLYGEKYETEQIPTDTQVISAWSMGYYCSDNLIYMFGVSSFKNSYNGLALLDLSQRKLSFSILSKDMSVPTPRRGHAMEVHEDTLYIFGGIDSSSNTYFIYSILDMWAFNLNQENWRPVLAQSYTLPSPRSEFAHAKYQEDFVIFGGKGDYGLLGDMYSYSISANKWKLISPDLTPSPSPRRASCMAVADDYILIYGGVDASGYNNELWKFEWATQSYTLLEASSPPPKSAFSQCLIYENSLNQMVFQVAMGESDGENPISFIYEYNLNSNQWLEIRPPSNKSSAARGKAAIFMIKDHLVVVGGTSSNNEAHDYIDVLHSSTGEVSRIGTLPSNFYYGASAYHKNKIYIHGGGDSFGTLPLKKTLKNGLLVINLNQNCEPSSMCISACSKGTYNKDGECYLCPKGSYSSSIGSNSCSICPSGYFSDSIGAVTMRTCKPCPYGYFNTEEGQASCLICPTGSMCSLNQIKPEIPSEIAKYDSIQPDLLEYCTEYVEISSMYFNIVISVILVLVIIPLIAYPNSREFLKKLDMYSHNHNYEENRPMRIKKTLIGGIFTTAFMFGSLAIIFNMFLSFALDNIRETRGLVPLLALQQQYESVIFI
jgi:N-acetylneuraminic acid mutarotase